MSEQNNKPLLSITKDDCEWIYQRGRGNGGQKKNKTNSAVICSHKPSKAQGYAEDMREQSLNRQLAFRRMVETKEFQTWLKTESLKKLGVLEEIESKVEKALKDSNIRTEIKKEGLWVEASVEELN